MKINIRGDKLLVTESIKSYIDSKLKKIEKYFENHEDLSANVLVRVTGRNQTIEVTIPTSHFTLRAEEAHDDLYAAVDLVVDKLERQIRKNKTRLKKKVSKDLIDFNTNFKIEKDEVEKGKIVKRKLVETKPMDEEEAILQMNLLGHNFFVFTNVKTGEVNVLYKRNDNDYGIIETKE